MKTLSAIVRQEGKWFVAECPEIGTVSQGKTLDESVANLRETTEIYLEEFPLDLKCARLF
ncbi:MAG: type II toxin-antitoxin system HicB family antitoxin [Chlamydiae bacterium]|nr:type II toxin-antitoxin system HicB family antitoxin [Chlamydiota bacterium]MBI3266051.1 type II toxin-antitoxin system HicB family antitoxin [Chlamydiota bacterium]